MEMIKGLEALKEYKKITCINCQYYYGNNCNNNNECFIKIIEEELKELEFIKKCLYVGNSGAIALRGYGYDNYEKLKEVLL